MLLGYVRHQQPPPTRRSVNHRLTVIRCLYRFHTDQDIPGGRSHFQRVYTKRSPLGYGRPHRAVAYGLRLKHPQDRALFVSLYRRLELSAAKEAQTPQTPNPAPQPQETQAQARNQPPAASQQSAITDDQDLRIVLPAFVTSELKSAFQVGFLHTSPFSRD